MSEHFKTLNERLRAGEVPPGSRERRYDGEIQEAVQEREQANLAFDAWLDSTNREPSIAEASAILHRMAHDETLRNHIQAHEIGAIRVAARALGPAPFSVPVGHVVCPNCASVTWRARKLSDCHVCGKEIRRPKPDAPTAPTRKGSVPDPSLNQERQG